MRVVQKLPVGLALAACMLMSSCSQEDLHVATPSGKLETGFSNQRGGPLQAVAQIPITNGPEGNNVFAPGWKKQIAGLNHLIDRPAGTSNKTYLWGNQNSPWTKPLFNPPGWNSNTTNNFITFVNQQNVLAAYHSDSKVESTIKHLQPGKKYALTVSVASAVCLKNGIPTQYANAAAVHIPNTISQSSNNSFTIFDLTGKQAEWVTKTIVFEAKSPEVTVFFQNWMDQQYYPATDTYLTYINGFIGENALVEVP